MGEREVSQGRGVLMGLVKTYFVSSMIVTVDNFTSAEMAEEMSNKTGNVRWDADKSLARPGRKQITATKLGVYLTFWHLNLAFKF